MHQNKNFQRPTFWLFFVSVWDFFVSICQVCFVSESKFEFSSRKTDETQSCGEELCDYISGSLKYKAASSPLGPEARSGEAKPGQRVSFTLLWGFVFTGGHAGTQSHVWILLALFSNTSHSQLERPGWWFYSIFNVLRLNLWQRGINSQDLRWGCKWNK